MLSAAVSLSACILSSLPLVVAARESKGETGNVPDAIGKITP